MATKTKTELLEEIEAKNKEIKELKKEIEKIERYKQYEDAAGEIAAMRACFVSAGFSEAEAFKLVETMVAQSMINNLSASKSSTIYRNYLPR